MKLAVVTNSTYDGLCYNAELIKQQLSNSVEVLHFDEAWYAYAAFHEFFAGRYGMGTSRTANSPLVFTTLDAQTAGSLQPGVDDPCAGRRRAPTGPRPFQ